MIMKRIIFTIWLLVLIVSTIPIEINAQWIQISGPTGVSDIAYNGNFIFAGNSSGIFKSSDFGASWINTNNGTNIGTVNKLSTSGTIVYAGTYNGVFKSSNNGLNWISINNGLTNLFITSLSPIDSFLFAGTPAGIFRSTDNGANWLMINNQLVFVSNIARINEKLFATRQGIWFSTDNGLNWNLSGLRDTSIVSIALHGSKIFVGTSDWGIYISNDFGQSWTPGGIAEGHQRIGSIKTYGSRMVVGNYQGKGGSYTTTDFGQNWREFNEGFPNSLPYVNCLEIVNDQVFAGTNLSIWKRNLATPFIDVGISKINIPAKDTMLYVGCISGTEIVPKITVENFGLTNQHDPFSIECKIEHNSNLVYSDLRQDTVSSLKSHVLSFNPFNSIPNDTGVYNVYVQTHLEMDSLIYNDTLSLSFRIYNAHYGKERNRGAPGDYGYFFANSTPEASCAEDQPIYHWEDTSGSISLIANGIPVVPLTYGNLDQGSFQLVDLIPFGIFHFYSSSYSTFNVNIDGYIYCPTTYPYPPAIIMPYRADLDFGDSDIIGRNLKYKITSEKLIFTYDRVPVKNSDTDSEDYLSFQVILYIGGYQSGNIVFQYDKNATGSSFLNKYNTNTLSEHRVGIDYGIQYFDVGIDYRLKNNLGILSIPGPIYGDESIAVAFGESEIVLPVELASFTSLVDHNNVTLNWQTSGETNNSGFDIERSGSDDKWSKTGFINGAGNSNDPIDYSFTDKNLSPGKYKYRLKQIDFNGNYEYFDLQDEVSIGIPDKFELSQNYPNPFNPVTNLEFGISELGYVSLKVYDVLGKEVKTLVNEIKQAGYYKVQFDGSSFASGVYFYELRSGSFVSQKRMLLLK
jgi:hypothetical protein